MIKGWTYKKLGEVGTFIRGGGFLKKDYVENGIPCIHYGQIHTVLDTVTKKHLTSIPESLRSKTKFASKGDIIFAITSEDVEGSCKCTAWLGDYDVAVGGHAAIYKHSLFPAYVSYFAKSPYFYKAKEKYVHGFKVMEIKPSDIAQIDIPVPSMQEQKRIVERLDAAFAHIDELKTNAENQLAEARALFQKALAKAMEPKEGWEEKTLGDLGDFKNGMNFAHNEKGVDLHLLGVGDFGNRFSIDNIGELQMISLNQQPSDEYLLKDGDIVFVRSNGNKQLVGRSLVVYPNGIPTTFSGFCIRFRKSSDNVDEKFLVYFLKSEETRKKLFGNGANISNLNQKILQSLVIPLPPLSEQQRIVERLDSISENVRKYEEIQRKIIAECDALKQALLRQVFE